VLVVTEDDIDPDTGAILRVRVSDPGLGYTSNEPANITIEDPPTGNTAQAEAVIRGNVHVVIVDGGEGFYVGNTSVRVQGDGEYAIGTVTVTGSVDQVLVIDGGTGFTDTPNVVIDAPASGNTATANATLSSGLEFVQQAQAQSITDDVFVKIQSTVNVDATVSVTPGIDALYDQVYDIVETIQKDVFLVENLDTSNNSFQITDSRFDQTLDLTSTYTLLANANANSNVLVLDTVVDLAVSDTLFVEGNSIGNVSNIASETNQVTLDTDLVEDLETGTLITVVQESVLVRDLLEISSYTVNTRETYKPLNSANNYLIVDDVTTNSFVINRANTADATNVLGIHLNKTKLLVPNHNYQLGDTVRLDTNVMRGDFRVEAATQNTITVDAPWTSGFQSGNVIERGIKITTTDPHGITSAYAANDKRVAVHFAEPLYYNRVYPISRVTTDSIYVDGHQALDGQTQVFYEKRIGTVSRAEPFRIESDLPLELSQDGVFATNIIPVSRSARLNDLVAHYASNSAVISNKHVSIQDIYLDTQTGVVVDRTNAGSVYSETVAVIDPVALQHSSPMTDMLCLPRWITTPWISMACVFVWTTTTAHRQ